jgi:hypothetical protein
MWANLTYVFMRAQLHANIVRNLVFSLRDSFVRQFAEDQQDSKNFQRFLGMQTVNNYFGFLQPKTSLIRQKEKF